MRAAGLSAVLVTACVDVPIAMTGSGGPEPEPGTTTGGTTGDALASTSTAGHSDACLEAPASCAGLAVWQRLYSQHASRRATIGASALAIAADGDIVATGTYFGILEIGGHAVPSHTNADVWVARFAPDGEPRWFRRFGGPDSPPSELGGVTLQAAGSVQFAADGDLLLTSEVFAAVDFGTGSLAGETGDPVVLRMSPGGEVRWARRLVAVSEYPDRDRFPLLVAELADGRLWLAGTLASGSVDLGGGLLKSVGWGDLFLAQLDANGEHLWSRRHGDVGHQELRGMAVTPDGGLLLTGGVEGTLEIDVVSVTSVGTRDAFLIKLDSEGGGSWGRRFGDVMVQYGSAVQADGVGISLVGRFESTIDLGGGPLTGTLDDPGMLVDPWAMAAFVARLTTSGTHVWSTALRADIGDVEVTGLARHGDGSLVLSGRNDGALQFVGVVRGHPFAEWFMVLDADGGPRWLQYVAHSAWAGFDREGAVLGIFDIIGPTRLADGWVGETDVTALVLARYHP